MIARVGERSNKKKSSLSGRKRRFRLIRKCIEESFEIEAVIPMPLFVCLY